MYINSHIMKKVYIYLSFGGPPSLSEKAQLNSHFNYHLFNGETIVQ